MDESSVKRLGFFVLKLRLILYMEASKGFVVLFALTVSLTSHIHGFS